MRHWRRVLPTCLSLATACALVVTQSRAQQQPPPAGGQAAPTPPAPTQPAAITPATTQSTTGPATRPNGNGARGITTQPGGALALNFREADINAVLDELSAAAGF